MAEKILCKPGTGADGQPFVTINPATGRPLKPEGELVDHDRLARRRLRDGDWVKAARADADPTEEEQR